MSSTMTVPEMPAKIDGICYYIWTGNPTPLPLPQHTVATCRMGLLIATPLPRCPPFPPSRRPASPSRRCASLGVAAELLHAARRAAAACICLADRPPSCRHLLRGYVVRQHEPGKALAFRCQFTVFCCLSPRFCCLQFVPQLILGNALDGTHRWTLSPSRLLFALHRHHVARPTPSTLKCIVSYLKHGVSPNPNRLFWVT